MRPRHLLPILGLLIACADGASLAPPPEQGQLEILVSMTGLDLDPGGAVVSVRVDGGPPILVAANRDTTLDLEAGRHVVQLDGLATNCAVQGEVSRKVRVRRDDIANLAFAVTCGAATGVIEVSVTTTGVHPDTDGYLVSVDHGAAQRLVDGTVIRFDPIAGGTHAVTLGDVAGNCAEAGGNPVSSVQVNTGGAVRDTVRLRLTVTCGELALLRVTAPTTGPDPDPEYLVRVDGGASHTLAAGGTLSLDLTAGAHLIGLTDVAANCTVGASNPVTVTLLTEAPTDLAFPVSCTARAGLDITITTTGNDPDPSYTLGVCVDDCDLALYYSVVPADTALQLDLPPASYNVYLRGVASNCRATGVGYYAVTAGQLTPVRIDVTCVHLADFVATVTATGTDVGSSFYLTVDGDYPSRTHITPGSPVTVTSFEGIHTIELGDIDPNCTATSPNPVTVTLVAGVLTPVNFTVDCAPLAVIKVTVSTTGANIPAGYEVGIDTQSDGGYTYTAPVAPNGAISEKVFPGTHTVWLDQVAANCTLSGPNGVAVSPGYGEMADVAFTVVCR